MLNNALWIKYSIYIIYNILGFSKSETRVSPPTKKVGPNFSKERLIYLHRKRTYLFYTYAMQTSQTENLSKETRHRKKSPHKRFLSLIRDHLTCQKRHSKKTQSDLVSIDHITKNKQKKTQKKQFDSYIFKAYILKHKQCNIFLFMTHQIFRYFKKNLT